MPTTAGRRRCRSPRWAARRWRRSRPRAPSSATRRRRWPSWSCPSSRAPRPPCRASSRMTDPSEAIEAWSAAAGRLSWERPAERTHVPGPGGGSWFPGGMLNVCANCLDRHLAERGDRVAFHWEGEPGDRRAITYRELHAEVCAFAAGLERTVVVRRTGVDVPWYEGDLWYDDLIGDDRPRAAEARPPALASEHPLLVAYIANRRGRPTGILHGSAGLLTAAATLHADGLTGADDDVLWFPVDVAWIAGQTHAVYGPLACGATSVIFEGMLDTPSHDRAWEIIERYGVTTFFTTPSVVRNLRRWSDSPPGERELGSLRHVATGGESIETELRDWLATEVGRGSALVSDGWGQTELGGVVTLTDTPHGPDALPDAGVDVVDGEGRSLPHGVEGELVLRHPWAG